MSLFEGPDAGLLIAGIVLLLIAMAAWAIMVYVRKASVRKDRAFSGSPSRRKS